MKLNNLLIFFILASTNLNAETSEDTNKSIDLACTNQATALVNQLKSDDWFTDYILNEEYKGKAGNKRLKR